MLRLNKMRETVIDFQTWADIFETSTDTQQASNTAQLVTVGTHLGELPLQHA